MNDIKDPSNHNSPHILNEGSPTAESGPMIHLAYVSTQTRLMSNAELLAMLEEARNNNGRHGITGLLLHKEDAFFQVLEGPELAVRRAFAGIAKDARHKHVEVLLEEALNDRQFPDWQMGFTDLDNVDATLVPGFSRFMQEKRGPRQFLAKLSASKRLAVMFRDIQ